jgi:hypothetical protein
MERIDTAEAAKRLGITGETVRAYVRLGWLDGKTPSGETGRGKPFFFDSDEVEAFKRGGAPAAKAYREARDLSIKPKRGRKVGAR